MALIMYWLLKFSKSVQMAMYYSYRRVLPEINGHYLVCFDSVDQRIGSLSRLLLSINNGRALIMLCEGGGGVGLNE